MASCVVCKTKCDDASDLKCSSCEGMFHLNCVKSDLEGKKVLRSSKEWKCRDCKSQSTQGSVASVGSDSGNITKGFLINVLEEFKKEVFGEIKSFKSEMSELSRSVEFISNKLDAANSLMEDIKKQFTGLQKENEQLKCANIVLKNEVDELRERIRNIEQYSRKNNVEVSGIPVTPGENVTEVVKDVGVVLGVQVQDSDIAAAHRIPAYRNDRQPSLIVQFQSRTMKNAWINGFREKKTLTAQQVNARLPNTRVYVNDHLSPDNKKFLGKLKQKCRDVGYAFAWARDGKFFVRKAQGDVVKRITNEKDIDNLK